MFRFFSVVFFYLLFSYSGYCQGNIDPKEQLVNLWNQGYIFSSLDSLSDSGDGFYRGERYVGHLAGLHIFDDATGTSHKASSVYDRSIHIELEKYLNKYADNGFPFVRLEWDSITLKDEDYLGYLTLFPGPKIVFDSLVLLGTNSVSTRFLERVLTVSAGQPYSEEAFQNIPDRMAGLNYLALTKPPDVTFQGGKAKIYLHAEQAERNSFEGVLGIFPGQSPTDQLAITGYLDLDLVNLFKTGKSLHFVWNRFSNESQSLDLNFKYPFVFGSPLFLQGDFNLFKQDTTFLNQAWEFLSGTRISKFSEVHFGLNSSRGNLINPSIANLRSGLADFELRNYQLGIEDIRFGRPMQWEEHSRYHIQVGVGNKQIIQNPNLDHSVYDSLRLKTQIFRIKAGLEYQRTFGKGKAFYQEIRGVSYSNSQILQNELERLGGLKSLRGFNENFYYAQHYLLSRLEFRQYFEQKSFVSAFGDHLYFYENGSYNFSQGYGFSISLETTNGLFSFAAALGATRSLSFDPTNVKIHIGYISVF
ncbi:MAG: hypothetical protein JXR10_14565 [Cyclobacteriaceae bacterium]